MSNGAPQNLAPQTPIVMGPPAHGSTDPTTASLTLLPETDLPNAARVEVEVSTGGGGSAISTLEADELELLADEIGVSYDDETSEADLLKDVEAGLGNLTKARLQDLAADLDVELSPNATKADIVAALTAPSATGDQGLMPAIGVPPDEQSRHGQSPEQIAAAEAEAAEAAGNGTEEEPPPEEENA